MGPKVQVWAYPWDVARWGVRQAVSFLQGSGVDALSMTSVYHIGQILSLVDGEPRIVGTPEGVAWGAPAASTLMEPFARAQSLDFVREVRQALTEAGMALRAWTIVYHDAGPQLAPIENAFGQPIPHAPCPIANAHHLAHLVDGLAELGVYDAIELESPGYTPAFHGSHHDIAGVRISPLINLLLSICFCGNCTQALQARGIDASAVRETVRSDLRTALSHDAASANGAFLEMANYFLDRPEVAALVRERADLAYGEVERAASRHPTLNVGIIAPVFFGTARATWLGGVRSAPFRHANGDMVVLGYGDSGSVAEDVRRYVDRGWGPERLVVGQTLVQDATPTYADAVSRIDAAVAEGASRFSFYNLGVMSPSRRRWLAQFAHRIKG